MLAGMVLSEMRYLGEPDVAFTTLERFLTHMCMLVLLQGTRFHKALIAISAFELLDAIMAILMRNQIAVLGEALAALMAYKRFLARVAAIVIIEIALMMGRVTASIASVPLD